MYRYFLKITDFFLTKKVESRSRLFRMRISLFVLLVGNSFNIFALIAALLNPAHKSLQIFTGILTLSCLSLLYLIKRGADPVKVMYFSFLAVILALLGSIIWVDKSMAAGFPHMLSVILCMGLLVIESSRRRIFFVGWIALVDVIFYLWSTELNVAYPFSLSQEGTFDLLLTFFPNVTIPILLCMMGYLELRKVTDREQEQEHEWQIRTNKLQEISSISAAVSPLMIKSLEAFSHEWQRSIEEIGSNRENVPNTIENMEQSLDDLIQISQSFRWIYRAYRSEQFCQAQSETILRQLGILLTHKVADHGWTIESQHAQLSIEMQGPIPSLILLLFTLIVDVVESSPPISNKQLLLKLTYDRKNISWSVCWPKRTQSIVEKYDQTRQVLIRDLLSECKARITHYNTNAHHCLLVQGSWTS